MEGGASPASLLSDEKLPKPAQNAEYQRKPASACTLQNHHDKSIQKLSDSIRYCAGFLHPSDTVSLRALKYTDKLFKPMPCVSRLN